jgi:DNA-binding transcriptional regulator YbjK
VSRLHDEGSKVITALQTEVQRLTEENVHLVGHTNLKQKIQMHAKVKDENQKQKVALAKLEGDLIAKERTVKRLQQELERLRGGPSDRENATPVNFSEEERLRVVLNKKEDEARRVRAGLHALLSRVSEVQCLLVKDDAEKAVVGDDGGDDDDARSCDSIRCVCGDVVGDDCRVGRSVCFGSDFT